MVNMPREIDTNFGGLQGHQRELLILGELSGIDADPAVYRIIIELLSLQIEPEAIYKLLRHIRRSKAGKHTSASASAKNLAIMKRK